MSGGLPPTRPPTAPEPLDLDAALVKRLRSAAEYRNEYGAIQSDIFTVAADALESAVAERDALRTALAALIEKFDAAEEAGTTFDGKAPPTMFFAAPVREWFNEARAALAAAVPPSPPTG